MITYAQARKLGAVRAAEARVLSLYLAVPLDPAELRGLPAAADDLIAAAEDRAGGAGRATTEDRHAVREKLRASGRDWLGSTVAVFACADAGLFEAFPLPGPLPGPPQELAVLGIRPHIRPLLDVLQRYPAYRVAVVDREHAWLFRIDGEETETWTGPAAAGVRGAGFGGWYGLESYRVQQRIARLARHHYHDTAASLVKAMGHDEAEPLVIGGHHEGIKRLLADLPPALLERFAGSFAVDVHGLTAARVRELAWPVVTRWAGQRADRIAGRVLATPAGGHLAADGLTACLAAVNAGAAAVLVVPEGVVVPGYECGPDGALTARPGGCRGGSGTPLPVPDLVEEMVTRTLDEGGQVCPVHGDRARFAARLRYPVSRD